MLGGGAARGFAHIGILRALLARGIVPDVVVGTSIGAAVGGAYVTGHLDAFEEWARGLQPRSVLSYLDIQLNGSGLIGGGKLAAELEQSIGRRLIEELPVKFAAIATEVATGHEIWLTHGRLVEAMRASYALPGIFSPVMIGDRWLVDGALVNPVPVSAARALGAEIVIAVNLNADNFGHGGTIAAFGTPPDAPANRPPHAAAAEERHRQILLRRAHDETRVLRQRRPARHLDGDGGGLQHHAGPHHPRAACRRSARCPDLAARGRRSAGSIFIAPRRRSRMAGAPPSARSNRSRKRSRSWRRDMCALPAAEAGARQRARAKRWALTRAVHAVLM